MNVGILGCGTIGGGVLTMIDELNSKDLKIVKVFDIPQKREIIGERLVTDVDEVCLSNDVDIVIEAMGGDEFPYQCIKKALSSKKHVITSNKEVVSLHMVEFYELAKENDVFFLCEASVGGGIPIIASLINSIKINKINHIYGIINGTTNFILTKMAKEGMDFGDALRLAQELGFAERDPSADLLGLDMIRKICILSSLAYGGYISYLDVYHRGIEKISKEILKDITDKGFTLKLVAESINSGDDVKIGVEPVLLTSDNNLSGVSYEFNAIYYESEKNGLLGFVGKGAGRFPTASAMVSDAIKIVEGGRKFYFESTKKFNISNHIDGNKYYLYNKGKGEIVDTASLDEIENSEFAARIF